MQGFDRTSCEKRDRVMVHDLGKRFVGGSGRYEFDNPGTERPFSLYLFTPFVSVLVAVCSKPFKENGLAFVGQKLREVKVWRLHRFVPLSQ